MILNNKDLNLKRSLADLQIGESGVIAMITDEEITVKLFEMGCLPGVNVKMCCRAPFGGPVCFDVAGYHLSLRIDEAKKVMLRN
jgi:ferrous iron transport protein A